jgi:hypothetical protein
MVLPKLATQLASRIVGFFQYAQKHTLLNALLAGSTLADDLTFF